MEKAKRPRSGLLSTLARCLGVGVVWTVMALGLVALVGEPSESMVKIARYVAVPLAAVAVVMLVVLRLVLSRRRRDGRS